MRELITCRSGPAYDNMIKIHDNFVEKFGMCDAYFTWDIVFADSTDNYVSFRFWKDDMATIAKLSFPELMSRTEFDNKDYESA